MVMKLYGVGTPNVQRATLPLYLLEVDIEKEVELVKVNLMTRQHLTPAYKSKQIFGVVPYLEDGDVAIFESRALAKYFVEKYEGTGPSLLGKTLKEKAIINTWMESEAHNFHPTVSPMVKEIFFSMMFKRPRNEEIISTGLKNLNTVLDVYEGHLSKNKYLAGESYTLADAFHTPYMEKVRTMEVFKGVIDSRPHVAAWVADITSRPAFQKCMQMDWQNATPLET
jgi:glutathione S-transferase